MGKAATLLSLSCRPTYGQGGDITSAILVVPNSWRRPEWLHNPCPPPFRVPNAGTKLKCLHAPYDLGHLVDPKGGNKIKTRRKGKRLRNAWHSGGTFGQNGYVIAPVFGAHVWAMWRHNLCRLGGG